MVFGASGLQPSSMADSWAAQTPSASAVNPHHGKLLPLLAPKAQDVRQLEVELAAAQKRAMALQQVNEELEKEAAEARRAELGTRPLMTRLMSTARKSQRTLTKLVSAISDYNLTIDEKEYLHSLAKDNEDMTEQLKNELPHFFDRIFVDSDRDFNMWAQTVTDAARPQDPASTPAGPPVPVTQRKSTQTRTSRHQPAYSRSTKVTKSTKVPAPAAHTPRTKTSS